MELRSRALAAFNLSDPFEKVRATQSLWQDYTALPLNTHQTFVDLVAPGRPALPELVHPQDVPRRLPFTAEGHSALIHSIAHIEFNAIKIAFNNGIPDDSSFNLLKSAQPVHPHRTQPVVAHPY